MSASGGQSCRPGDRPAPCALWPSAGALGYCFSGPRATPQPARDAVGSGRPYHPRDAGVATLIPETTVRTSGRVDWAGAGWLGLGSCCCLVAVSQRAWGWVDPHTLSGIGGALARSRPGRGRATCPAPFVDLSLVVRHRRGWRLLAGSSSGPKLFGSQAAVGAVPRPANGHRLRARPHPRNSSGSVPPAFSAAACRHRAGTASRPSASGACHAGVLPLVADRCGLPVARSRTDPWASSWSGRPRRGRATVSVLSALAAYVVVHAPVNAVGISAGIFKTPRSVGAARVRSRVRRRHRRLLVSLPGSPKPITSEAGYVTVWLGLQRPGGRRRRSRPVVASRSGRSPPVGGRGR